MPKLHHNRTFLADEITRITRVEVMQWLILFCVPQEAAMLRHASLTEPVYLNTYPASLRAYIPRYGDPLSLSGVLYASGLSISAVREKILHNNGAGDMERKQEPSRRWRRPISWDGLG
ncbi:hypothetical protein Daesc_000525 [Daldinia eschscholtzii]|uniref:Uncharacterized protein n=1 Tax=Daldinia eschscholtzii TaxID=292717 RepID=A0AAX6MZA4_9PEZI